MNSFECCGTEQPLDDEAFCFEYAADPLLATAPGNRRENLVNAERLLDQEATTIRNIIKQDPTHEDWQLELAGVQVRLGSIRQSLHQPGDIEEMSRDGLAVAKRFAPKEPASARTFDIAVSSLLRVEPESLRQPQLTVDLAERGVAVTHRKRASSLLELAQAFRVNGQPGEGVAAAKEGLALLPQVKPGDPAVRVRRLLEFEVRSGP